MALMMSELAILHLFVSEQFFLIRDHSKRVTPAWPNNTLRHLVGFFFTSRNSYLRPQDGQQDFSQNILAASPTIRSAVLDVRFGRLSLCL